MGSGYFGGGVVTLGVTDPAFGEKYTFPTHPTMAYTAGMGSLDGVCVALLIQTLNPILTYGSS
jgi:hypothetical protein